MPKFMKIEISRTSTSWLNIAVPDGVEEAEVRELASANLDNLIAAQLDDGQWSEPETAIEYVADSTEGECRCEGAAIYDPKKREFYHPDTDELEEWIAEQEEIEAERDAATPAPGQL